MYDTIIIGGGFSGLVTAVKLCEKLKRGVAVLERTDRVGKKILATGNGRGNLTNVDISVNRYHGNDVEFSRFAIEKYDGESIKAFFKGLGLLFTCENGKYYPASLQASSICDVLRFKLKSLGCDVFTDSEVISVTKGEPFKVTCANGKTYETKNVVVSTGGKAQRQFGTDGSFYKVCNLLGHTVTPVYPSLVQLKCDTKVIRGLKGIKQTARVGLVSGNNVLTSSVGDLLFTDFGVSGDSVFKVSAYVEGRKGLGLNIEFLPEVSESELLEVLTKKVNEIEYLTAEEILIGIVNKMLGVNILKRSGVTDLTQNAKKVNLKLIAHTIKNYTLDVTGTLGFDYAQVTHGGVSTAEIDGKTMQSKIVDNLYFTGEIIDIDGDCGGYNLQWAYSSASVCADAILNND